MKKFLSILALVLVVAMCASFAVSAETVEITNVTSNNTSSKDITLDYDAVEDAEVVYSVDVTWDNLEFAFDAGKKTYDAESHTTTTPEGTWTTGSTTVEVFNHSNAAVKVKVTASDADNGTATLTVTNGDLNLESAEGKTNVKEQAPNTILKTATITASGKPESSAKIGTVTVTITAATN